MSFGMAAMKEPQVLRFSSPASFLTYVLRHHAFPSTMIVCASESMFLHALLASLRLDTHSPPSTSPDDVSSDTNTLLLRPTLHQLAISRTVSVVFTPTILHLRAYLTVYAPSRNPPREFVHYDKPGTNAPILAILNLVTTHRYESEYSAQGLSRSLALAVEAAARGEMQLMLSECNLGSVTAEEDLDAIERERDPWKDEVPVLKSSIRFGHDDRAWAGRTVEVRKLASRWCKFDSEIDPE